MLHLRLTHKKDADLVARMKTHYSQPRSFVGRSICYAVFYGANYYGDIVAGSATRFLPNRDVFYSNNVPDLNNIVSNVFYNVTPINGKYPCRNFTSTVVALWRWHLVDDWRNKYGDVVLGFETLVELPRSGELYKRDGWLEVGQTKGFTCKRDAGVGTDSWSGKRVWDTTNLRPKRVFMRLA